MRCRSVDIGEVTRRSVESQAATLTAELGHELDPAAPETVLACRGRHRWSRTFEPVRLSAGEDTPFRHRGVYLITGGLGRLGWQVAQYLAREASARLVLVGRSAEAAAQGELVRQLEASGAEVLVAAADVTDRRQMENTLAAARERFGALDGVFHAAGVFGLGLVAGKSADEARRVLAPKVAGARLLADLLRREELDFLVLFSSLSSVAGGLGVVDYSAANAFLGAFAEAESVVGELRVVTVDWAGWRDVGISSPEPERDRLSHQTRDLLEGGIRPPDGLELLRRILARPLPRVLVSPRDLFAELERVESSHRSAPQRAAAGPVALGSRPRLDTPYRPPRDELEEAIVELWQELLGIAQVGIDDNFYELGGHSLLATRVASRLRDLFGVEVPLEQVLGGPTATELATAVAEQQASRLGDDDLNRLLGEVQEMSEEELLEELPDDVL